MTAELATFAVRIILIAGAVSLIVAVLVDIRAERHAEADHRRMLALEENATPDRDVWDYNASRAAGYFGPDRRNHTSGGRRIGDFL